MFMPSAQNLCDEIWKVFIFMHGITTLYEKDLKVLIWLT